MPPVFNVIRFDSCHSLALFSRSFASIRVIRGPQKWSDRF